MRRIIDGARILVLAGLIVGATHGPARAQNQTCSEFAQFALGALQDSQVGSSAYMAGLLATQPAAPQFVEKIADKTFRKRAAYLLGVSGLKTSATECRFDGKVSARAVASPWGDRLDEDATIDCVERSKTGAFLRVKLAEGQFKLLNPARSFKFASSPENALTPQDAVSRVLEIVPQLGIPSTETAPESAMARVVYAAASPTSPTAGGVVRKAAEVMTLVGREVAGLPVFDSGLTAAVDAQGRIARLNVRWPYFCVAPGLAQKVQTLTLSKTQVVANVAERLGQDNACSSLEKLSAEVMWVRTNQVDGGPETQDDRDESETDPKGPFASEPCYVPALVVRATPNQPRAEGDGSISMGAPEYVIPLFKTAPAS